MSQLHHRADPAAAAAAKPKAAAPIQKLDETAWKTENFYHYDEADYRKDLPAGYDDTAVFNG